MSKQQSANSNQQPQPAKPFADSRLLIAPLRIGIDATPATRAVKTGTERYAEALILEFARMKLPHQFILYSRYAPTGELAHLPKNFTWKVMPFPFLWSQVRLAIEFLLHPNAVDVMFFPAHVMPLIHPKRSVITLHDIGFEHFPELYGQTPIGPNLPLLRQLLSLVIRIVTLGRYGNSELDYHRWATRFALNHATAVITVSEATKKDIIEHFHPVAPISPIYHGINLSKQQAASSKQRKTIQQLQPYILFIGRLEAKKNVVTLIQAFGQLVAERSIESSPSLSKRGQGRFGDLNLVLIGRPSHGYADIADAIQALPADIQSRVHELGYVEDVQTWLTHAKLFAFPSAFEGFGLPPLEAMAVGIPVVAANGTSLPEIVGDAGLLVPTFDVTAWEKALERGLTDAKLRQSLIANGHARVKTFTWRKSATETLAVITNAAGIR